MPEQTPTTSTTAQQGTQTQQTDNTTLRATGAGVNTGAGTTRPKTEAEIEADKRYEEAMEEEYAKREGGA